MYKTLEKQIINFLCEYIFSALRIFLFLKIY